MSSSVTPPAVVAQANLNDLLTARVRGFLAEVLPDEMVKQFADKAVEEFLHDRSVPNPNEYEARNGKPTVRVESEMTKMIREIVNREMAKRIADQLKEIIPEIMTNTVSKEQTRDLAMQTISAIGPAALTGVVQWLAEPLVKTFAEQLRWSLQNKGIQL